MELPCRDCKDHKIIEGTAYASADKKGWLCEKHFDRERRKREEEP